MNIINLNLKNATNQNIITIIINYVLYFILYFIFVYDQYLLKFILSQLDKNVNVFQPIY